MIFFIGTSTGSLLIPHRLNKTEKIKRDIYFCKSKKYFNRLPFLIKYVNGGFHVSISHVNVLLNLIRGSKTFGESYNLKFNSKIHNR
jgi:hypothetical protein